MMATTIKYKTKQSEELLTYLRTTKGNHITANDIVTHFEAQGKKIGLATIYRQLERLVDVGLVNKYYLAQGGGAQFEYIDRAESCAAHCFHCKCQLCGTLIHLSCEALEQVQSHLQSQHDFVLDPIRTVFYGTCKDCSTPRAE